MRRLVDTKTGSTVRVDDAFAQRLLESSTWVAADDDKPAAAAKRPARKRAETAKQA